MTTVLYGENRMFVSSAVLDVVHECDGQTDRQTDRNATEIAASYDTIKTNTGNRQNECYYSFIKFYKLEITIYMPLLAGRWSCCDLDLWPFDPKHWSVHPCPKMHQRWKCGEIQSSNLQDIALPRPKSALLSSMFDPIVNLNPKLDALILVPNCTTDESFTRYWLFVSRHSKNTFQDTVLTTFGTHRQTVSHTHEQPEHIIPPAAQRWWRHNKQCWQQCKQ